MFFFGFSYLTFLGFEGRGARGFTFYFSRMKFFLLATPTKSKLGMGIGGLKTCFFFLQLRNSSRRYCLWVIIYEGYDSFC